MYCHTHLHVLHFLMLIQIEMHNDLCQPKCHLVLILLCPWFRELFLSVTRTGMYNMFQHMCMDETHLDDVPF